MGIQGKVGQMHAADKCVAMIMLVFRILQLEHTEEDHLIKTLKLVHTNLTKTLWIGTIMIKY